MSGRSGNFTYPLKFSTVYAVVDAVRLTQRADSMSGNGIDSITTSNCYCYGGASQVNAHFIVAVGK